MSDVKFSHLDSDGRPNMVDITDKSPSKRSATAEVLVCFSDQTGAKVRSGVVSKGNIEQVAIVAGIQAAKKTSDLIPLCHAVPIESVSVEMNWLSNTRLQVVAISKTMARTGVEMESMVAANIAALTIYDMCKGIDKSIQITDCRLVRKTGGKSGDYTV